MVFQGVPNPSLKAGTHWSCADIMILYPESSSRTASLLPSTVLRDLTRPVWPDTKTLVTFEQSTKTEPEVFTVDTLVDTAAAAASFS